jgi:cytochrome P450
LEQEDPKCKLSEDELIGNFLTFFFAGMDTTGHFINSMLWFFSRDEAILKKLMEEIDANFKDFNDITMEKIQGLQYMSACIKEGLRLVPPTPIVFPRKAIADHKLGDLKVKKGTIVDFSIVALPCGKGLTEEEKFKPERWLDGETDKV